MVTSAVLVISVCVTSEDGGEAGWLSIDWFSIWTGVVWSEGVESARTWGT